MLETFLINLTSFWIYWHGCPCSQVAFPLDNVARSCLQRQIDTGYKASAVLWDKDGLKLFLWMRKRTGNLHLDGAHITLSAQCLPKLPTSQSLNRVKPTHSAHLVCFFQSIGAKPLDYLSMCLCIYLSISPSISLAVSLCIYLSVYLSIYLCIYLSI